MESAHLERVREEEEFRHREEQLVIGEIRSVEWRLVKRQLELEAHPGAVAAGEGFVL